MQLSNWFNVVDKRRQISIGTSQKCGFGSLNLGKYEYGMLKRPFPMFDERYWVVREPVARFRSFYKHIVRGRAFTRLNWLGEQLLTTDECLSFIEEHLTSSPDPHWVPQSRILNSERAILIPLHHLGDIFPGKREHITNSEDIPLSVENIAKIRQIYANDVVLYEKALKTDCTSLPRIKHA